MSLRALRLRGRIFRNTLTKKNDAFSVPLRATSCQMLGTSCQRSCQPKQKLKSSCKSLMFVPISAKYLELRSECRVSQGRILIISPEVRANGADYNFITEKAKLSWFVPNSYKSVKFVPKLFCTNNQVSSKQHLTSCTALCQPHQLPVVIVK